MVVHEKSRLGGRATTDPIREGAARALVQKLDRDYEDKRFILLGDFNDNPDDKSLNILEAGDIEAQGGAEENEDTFLSNPADHLVALDKVSHGKSAADINPQTGRINVITTGSRARNNDNRGNNTNTGDILFDQILFPAVLRALYVNDSFQIFDAGIAIEGTGGSNGDQASITYRYMLTSFSVAQAEEIAVEEQHPLLACELPACWQIRKEKTKVRNLSRLSIKALP
jgi:Endonuclease/Exonuclease/phosphatase family